MQQAKQLPTIVQIDALIDLMTDCDGGFDQYEASEFTIWQGHNHPALGEITAIQGVASGVLLFSESKG